MNKSVKDALAQFYAQFEVIWQKKGRPSQDFDEEWPSPCQIDQACDGKIQWRPILRTEPANFNNIETALELTIHDDIHQFYGHYFSDNLPALFNDNPITLIQPWNEADYERLQQNMIQHLMMLKQIKQPTTLFLASTNDDMELISLKNDTGEIIVERLGEGQVDVLAKNLPEFILKLVPDPDNILSN